MTQSLFQIPPAKAFLATALTTLLALALASSAWAGGLEPAGHFAGSAEARTEEEIEADEEVQLGGVGGMAVNRTGAGGVPAGTLYALSASGRAGGGHQVAMYEPGPGGGLEFAQAWEINTQASEEKLEAEGKAPYEVCGPEAEELPSGSPPFEHAGCQASTGGNPARIDVVVDQQTGNVYAMRYPVSAGNNAITEYTPTGSEAITHFGEEAPGSDLVAESPEKLHGTNFTGPLAVNEAGWVYVYDSAGTGFENHHRLAVFEPASPGDYSEYQYAGEVAGGNVFEGPGPTMPVADEEGNIYVASASSVEEYPAAEAVPGPYPHASTPSCSFRYKTAGIEALGVDPESGEPYFSSYNTPEYVHELGPCEEGKFSETGTVEVAPGLTSPEASEGTITALAFDPARPATPGRPPGVLYGGIASVGIGHTGYSALGYLFAPPGAAAEWNLTVSKTGTGNGWIHSEAPAYAINCGGPCSTKTASFAEGTVPITASGSQFAGWESCPGTEAGRVCEVSLTEDTEAVAEFVENHALTVSKTGTGNGWIHSESPAYAINCGGPCTTKTGFFTQSTVTLTASGSEFQEWTSCPGTVSGRECTVALSEDKAAEAKFE